MNNIDDKLEELKAINERIDSIIGVFYTDLRDAMVLLMRSYEYLFLKKTDVGIDILVSSLFKFITSKLNADQIKEWNEQLISQRLESDYLQRDWNFILHPKEIKRKVE